MSRGLFHETIDGPHVWMHVEVATCSLMRITAYRQQGNCLSAPPLDVLFFGTNLIYLYDLLMPLYFPFVLHASFIYQDISIMLR